MILDVLKLYPGEDVVRQEPDDVDPNGWIDEGELTELPEVSLGERERVHIHGDRTRSKESKDNH